MTAVLRLPALSQLSRYGFIPLSLALGALLAQAMAPVHFVWGVPLALGLIAALLLRAETAKRGAWMGWLFGLGYFGLALSWIVEPFQIDADRYAWMAPFAQVFLGGGLALFWALAFGMAARVQSPGHRLLVLIGLWSLAEFGRAYVLTGLPWAAFGQFWIDTPAARLLPWIGPQGLAVLTLAVTLPLGLVMVTRRWALAASPLVLALGALLLVPPPPEVALTNKLVRLVQPNAPQEQKWDPDHSWKFVRRQLAYSRAGARPDLIVWPETAVPQLLNNAEGTLTEIAKAAGGVPVVLGILRVQADRYYNSLVVLDSQGREAHVYDKAHLVPFGEYVPFGDLMARFGIYGFASQAGAGFAAGPGPQVLDLGLGKALALICYEAVFPHLLNAAPERADMLIQITNDAWFGAYSGPYQHLVQARMRAAEQGLPMIRVANTGVSAMIDPYGRIREMLPLGEAGYIDALLPQPLAPTLYSRSGDAPIFGLLLMLALGGMWRRRAARS